jgi:hypothetical protein
MKPSNELINGIKAGLAALRAAHVEPMGLSITPHNGTFGWGFFKFKALPGHPNPGNAGNGWSHPTDIKAFEAAHAPRDWPSGGSFPWDWKTSLAEVKEFVREIAERTGFGTDYTLECAWREPPENDMTVLGTVGILSDINVLRGGAEHYAYYPDGADDISCVDKEGKPLDPEKEEHIRKKFRNLKAQERRATDKYMTPPETDNPVTIAGAWYVDTLPGTIVAELTDGSLASFAISPFRALTVDALTPYDGKHPRKLRGVPVPAALYPYYGLGKSEETLSEVLRVRLSPSELERVKAAADAAGKTVSEFARDWIRSINR